MSPDEKYRWKSATQWGLIVAAIYYHREVIHLWLSMLHFLFNLVAGAR